MEGAGDCCTDDISLLLGAQVDENFISGKQKRFVFLYLIIGSKCLGHLIHIEEFSRMTHVTCRTLDHKDGAFAPLVICFETDMHGFIRAIGGGGGIQCQGSPGMMQVVSSYMVFNF